MSTKRDGATVSVPREVVAWELVKMVCDERERCYIEQESKLRGMVDAYRLTGDDWKKSAPLDGQPSIEAD